MILPNGLSFASNDAPAALSASGVVPRKLKRSHAETMIQIGIISAVIFYCL